MYGLFYDVFDLNYYVLINFSLWKIFYFLLTSYKFIIPIIIFFFANFFVCHNNPITALLALIFIFFNMSWILLSIRIEFLALIFLIIYIGAISILFLFVIMMFNLKQLRVNEEMHYIYTCRNILIQILIYAKVESLFTNNIGSFLDDSLGVTTYWSGNLNGELDYFIDIDREAIDIDKTIRYQQDILIISDKLYNLYGETFIILSYVLLSAMVGAIIVALSTVD